LLDIFRKVILLAINGNFTYLYDLYLRKMATRSVSFLDKIPKSVDSILVQEYLNKWDITYKYFAAFKDYSNLNDIEISGILDLNVKTFRSYKTSGKKLSDRLQEHTIALIALFKHGIDVFGSDVEFKNWLKGENFFFDNDSPGNNLKTFSGIKFIDDRLTAMEYGDNI